MNTKVDRIIEQIKEKLCDDWSAYLSSLRLTLTSGHLNFYRDDRWPEGMRLVHGYDRFNLYENGEHIWSAQLESNK